MRDTHEPVRFWPPCCVCGRPAPYEHLGKRYCVRNPCQLVASKAKS